MSKNIEMNIKTEEVYEIVYPKTLVENIVNIENTLNNYYTKEQTANSNTLTDYGLLESNTPNDILQKLLNAGFIKKVTQTINHTIAELDIYEVFSIDGWRFQVLTPTCQYSSLDSKKGMILKILGVNQSFQWGTSSSSVYTNGPIDTYLVNTLKNQLPTSIKNKMQSLTIQVDSNSQASISKIEGVVRDIFCLSAGDISNDYYDGNHMLQGYIGNNGVSGQPSIQWLRSPSRYTNSRGVALGNMNGSISLEDNRYSKTSKYPPCAAICVTSDLIYKTETKTYYEVTDIGSNIVPGLQSYQGLYEGTGTSGSSNPITLTFPFTPSFVIITSSKSCGSDTFSGTFLFSWANELVIDSGSQSTSTDYCPVSYSNKGKTISWYNSQSGTEGAKAQGNEEGVVYYYLAIGNGELS